MPGKHHSAPRGEAEWKALNLRLPSDIYQCLEWLAERDNRSVGNYAQTILKRHVANSEAEDDE